VTQQLQPIHRSHHYIFNSNKEFISHTIKQVISIMPACEIYYKIKVNLLMFEEIDGRLRGKLQF
jgi:hypothetical protein